MEDRQTGFTLLEIMIVVAIIGVIAALALPNYLRAGRRAQMNACIANLRLLESAVQEVQFSGVSKVDISDIVGANKFIKIEPLCPRDKSKYIDLDPPVCPSFPATHNLQNLPH